MGYRRRSGATNDDGGGEVSVTAIDGEGRGVADEGRKANHRNDIGSIGRYRESLPRQLERLRLLQLGRESQSRR